MKKLKLALLGCGDVAQRDYLPEFHRIADKAVLVAVCGRTADRAKSVAAQYGIPAWYTDHEEMLAVSDADAVINLTPIQLHAEMTRAALRANKHVYSEKPVAGSVEDASQIRDDARRHGLTLVCAPSLLLYPQLRYALARVAAGDIGEVYSARGSGHGGVPPWGGYPSDPSPFFARGGGPAIDMGVYPLHALTGIIGPAQRVTAMTAQAQRSFDVIEGPLAGATVPIEAPDNWHIVLDFGGQRLASVEASNCVLDSRSPQLELFGLDGTIALNLLDVSAPIEILRAARGWESIELPRTGRASGPDHILGVEHLVDCVQTGQSPVLSVDHAIHVLEIIIQAEMSAQTGQVMDIRNTFRSALAVA